MHVNSSDRLKKKEEDDTPAASLADLKVADDAPEEGGKKKNPTSEGAIDTLDSILSGLKGITTSKTNTVKKGRTTLSGTSII